MSFEDQTDRGRPSTVNNQHLKILVEEKKNHVEMLDNVFQHFNNIEPSRKVARWKHPINGFHMNLLKNQRVRRFGVYSMLGLQYSNDPFLKWIVTCGEKLILYNNYKRSAQWIDHDKAPKHFLKPKLHQQTIMVTVQLSVIGVYPLQISEI